MKYDFDLNRIEASAADAEAFLRSLANRHRLMVLCLLLDGELPAGELARRVGLAPSTLSQHLAALRDEGLVATRRDVRTIFYRIASERVRPVLEVLYSQFCAPGAPT